jgi:hypothetical protein
MRCNGFARATEATRPHDAQHQGGRALPADGDCLTAMVTVQSGEEYVQCFLNQRWTTAQIREVPDELQSFRATGSALHCFQVQILGDILILSSIAVSSERYQ